LCNGITASVCGNNVTEIGEACDGVDLGGATCGSQGFTGGVLSCSACAFNTSACATCGNSVVEAGETCDDGVANNGTLNYCNATCNGYTPGSTNPWITIPAGDFVMGCAAADVSCNGDGREGPKHTVTLPEYKIQKYEVSNAQYAACVAASACTAPSNVNSATRTPYYGNATYDNYPMTNVDWNMATTYCVWTGGRLPTEAEWEKAARGPSPDETIHPWGNGAANCTLANYSGCTGDTDDVSSHPTGASYYGALNMTGNVKEWVNDWYAINYYTTGGPPWIDPQGPGSGSYHVLRGGSWYGGATELRASDRDSYYGSDYGYGFRCAKNGLGI
jgi:formylglycine-generating enzyme required for sulfatase activity